jgi:hypothetical protein
MRHVALTLSLAFALAACGSPKDEDKLTADAIRASESAPELPEINLSEDPEPEPAVPPPAEPANDLANMIDGNMEAGSDELAPLPSGTPIPASFHGRWGVTVEDCADPRREGSEAVVIGSTRIDLPDASGQLAQTLGNFPERFVGMFVYNGDAGRWSQKEELSLTGSSNVLVRDADGERFRYRRCTRPKV